jgi:hypothetical protein
MGATKIMIIRHGEKPGTYNDKTYDGVDATGTQAGSDGAKHLITMGWERAGGLVTLFVSPWGPKGPTLATPQYLYASNPNSTTNGDDGDSGDEGPSQRPYETLTAVAAALGSPTPMTIDTNYAESDYDKMVADVLDCQGVVLIAWQHEDIPLLNKTGQPGISQCILTQTQTPSGTFTVPSSWPKGSQGARYDLVWVFDRPTGSGTITDFTIFAQMLLAGDAPAPPPV